MNRKINELIPRAFEAVHKSKMVIGSKVNKEYKGYIASMGAGIIQSGLLPAVAFYSSTTSESAKDKEKLMKAILILLNEQSGNDSLLTHILKNTHGPLQAGNQTLTFSDLDKVKLARYEKRISDILISLKLVIRTFEQVETT